MDLSARVDRTRTQITRGLRVAVAEDGGDAYRTASTAPLEGEWVGAFAQPAVIMRSVTAMSVTLGEHGGASVDEYGEAKLQIVHADRDRVEWIKTYSVIREGQLPLRYLGRISGNNLAGYWHAVGKPAFCGVFWLARPDLLAPASREALRARVRSSSVPRVVAQTVMTGLCIAAGVGLILKPVVALVAVVALLAIIALGVQRAVVMKREAEGWRALIG